MQTYRLNYTLLIGLIVGTFVASGAVYGLWSFQMSRNSKNLLVEAESAIEKQDYRNAAKFYSQYLAIQTDDIEARRKLSDTYVKLMDQDDFKPDDYHAARNYMETTVRSLPDEKEMRRQLVDLYAKVNNFQDALSHTEILLEDDPDNPELQVLKARYLIGVNNYDKAIEHSFKLIGYDTGEEVFDTEKALAPHDEQVYANLASVLRVKKDETRLADQVINQLVEANPESAKAYLLRGQYFITYDQDEAGRADVRKAYELDPKNADILLAMAGLASDEEDFDKAREYVQEAKKLHPEDPRFYQALAGIENQVKDQDAAMAALDEGIKALGGNKAHMLLIYKADLQFQNQDLEGVRQTIEDLVKLKISANYIRYLEARILLAEQKWFDASRELERLRTPFENTEIAVQIDMFLGLCYERLGQWGLASDSYSAVLQRMPDNQPALAGQYRVDVQRGVTQEIKPRGKDQELDAALEWQQFFTQQMQLPKAERNWTLINEKLLAFARERDLEEGEVKLMQAQLALTREDFTAARKLLQEADQAMPNNLRVRRLAIESLRTDPKHGPAVAMKMLENVEKEFGDQPGLRVQRAQMLVALAPDDLQSQLLQLSEAPSDWTTDQKVELWASMATLFLHQNMMEDATRMLTQVADNRPNDLPTRVRLFSLALQAGDEEGIEAAQNKILDIVKDKNDATWLYTEAQRQLQQVMRGQRDRSELPNIKIIIDRAITQRNEWNELYLLSAELELLAGNAAAALQNFERAASLGKSAPAALEKHIKLVAQMGNYNRAKELLAEMPENLRQPLLGTLYAEILFRTNDVENAIASARLAASANESNPQTHLWLAQLLARSAQRDDRSTDAIRADVADAIGAVKKSLSLQPESPDAWFLLTTLYAGTGQVEQARQTLRDAQLVVSDDNLSFLLAKGYEAIGAWFDAETMYRALYEADASDPARAHQLAEFYLGRAYPRPDKLAKATPLINQILKLGAEEKIPADDPHLFWARREAAKMLAATGDYQQAVKAEKLLASNSREGILTLQDKLQLAEILAPRPEPESRKKAAALLEEVAQLQPLSLQHEVMLGRLYYQLGDWNRAKSQMLSAIPKVGDANPAVRQAFVRMLLERGSRADIEEADRQVRQLRNVDPKRGDPNHPVTAELAVRVAAKTGRQQEAREDLLRRVQQILRGGTLEPAHFQSLELAASLLVELGDLENAEKVHRFIYEKQPAYKYKLATFLGLHRDVEQCFEMLNEIYTPDNIHEVIEVGSAVVRHQRDQVGDKYDAQIDEWFDRALRENPESIAILMDLSDFRDTQQKYDQAAEILSQLLKRSDLTGFRRAIVLNNLSYLAALTDTPGGTKEDALKLVEEAKDIMGPTADILDTRAVVEISKGNFERAVSDLELSVTDQPTAVKYFHKAQAHLGMKENRLAIEAWEKAEELGLNREELNRLEHAHYDETKQKINSLRGSEAVTSIEPLRRAG